MHPSESDKPTIFNGVGTGKVRCHELFVVCETNGRNGTGGVGSLGRRAVIPKVNLLDIIFNPGMTHKVPVRTSFLHCATFFFDNEPKAREFAIKVGTLAREHNRIEDVLSKNRNRRDMLEVYASNVLELHRTSPLLSGKHIKTRR